MQDLGNLKIIGGFAFFGGSKITSLGNLKEIGEDARFENSKITSLGNLERIGGNAVFSNSEVQDLGNLEEIGGVAIFEGSKITNFGNLRQIKGKVYFGEDEHGLNLKEMFEKLFDYNEETGAYERRNLTKDQISKIENSFAQATTSAQNTAHKITNNQNEKI